MASLLDEHQGGGVAGGQHREAQQRQGLRGSRRSIQGLIGQHKDLALHPDVMSHWRVLSKEQVTPASVLKIGCAGGEGVREA